MLTGIVRAGICLILLGVLSGCGLDRVEPPVYELNTEQSIGTELPTQSESSAETLSPLAESDALSPSAEQVLPPVAEHVAESHVLLGDEQSEVYLPILEGKRVALFSNHTGVVGNTENGRHILDVLLEQGVDVTVIFSPEHGFRGTEDAGDAVGDSVDEKTGLPIISLYGSNGAGSFSAENLAQFDTLVIDIQDVGLRYYTYYLTMYDLMDVCGDKGKEVVLFDRPNPNGFYVDGPILQEGYHSAVGKFPIPVVHGLTLGELALMINGEGWLKAGKDACRLTVVPCKNYTHRTNVTLCCAPSPNLKNMQAIYLYASTCFFENTIISVGRGTESPFEIYGSPYLEGTTGNDFSFVPQSMPGATNPPFAGQTCYGRDLRETDPVEIREKGIDLTYLADAYADMQSVHPELDFWGKPDRKGRYWIDLLSGSDVLRRMITDGYSPEDIKACWEPEVETFRKQRTPYLLYEE